MPLNPPTAGHPGRPERGARGGARRGEPRRVAAAVAVSDQILLISTGVLIGNVALRFTSSLFIRWLDDYPRLETAGFLSFAFVGIRLLLHVMLPSLNQPDWLTLLVVLVLFVWGFSVRSIEALDHAG